MFEERVLVPAHRVTRIQTYQGHQAPSHGYYPSFGFESDTPPQIEHTGDPEEYAPGATAQNGFQPVVYYQCSHCEAVVRDNDVPTHHCEVDDGPTH